jgi:hypothetical protein
MQDGSEVRGLAEGWFLPKLVDESIQRSHPSHATIDQFRQQTTISI